MNAISGSILLGILIAIPIIIFLGDLNAGAVGLVVVICVGIAGLLVSFFGKFRKRNHEKK
jgi:hypothetical protein